MLYIKNRDSWQGKNPSRHLIVLECTHVQGKNPNRELSETDENVTFKFNWRLFKREGCYSSSLKMTNLGEFPRNWFLANAQRRHCRLFTFSIKRERGITRFHDVCTFCVKNTIPFSAGQKLLHFTLKELIHFKSKGVFPSNINRRDKAWWFMIGPSHGIHQSSWLKLHWVVTGSVSLISFLSEFFFHFGSISHNTKWCHLFFEILINWSVLYFWSKYHWVPSEN